MAATTATVTSRDREVVAERLLRASAENSFEPDREIDWDAPLVPGKFFLPERRVTLYGTDLWRRMPHDQRVELSRHEAASAASVGIWFEVILMQLLARHIYDRDPVSQHVRYALVEVADECRHSVMFSRLIEKLGCPAYGPGRRAHFLARVMKTVSAPVESFAAILIAEELLDTLQREAMRDDDVQPLVRDVSRIHVIEEARHVRYAREELTRRMRQLPAAQRAGARLVVARTAQVIADRIVNPRVYAAVGLDQRQAHAVARANPHARETRRWMAARLVGFFRDIGLIGGPGLALWRRAGLV